MVEDIRQNMFETCESIKLHSCKKKYVTMGGIRQNMSEVRKLTKPDFYKIKFVMARGTRQNVPKVLESAKLDSRKKILVTSKKLIPLKRELSKV